MLFLCKRSENAFWKQNIGSIDGDNETSGRTMVGTYDPSSKRFLTSVATTWLGLAQLTFFGELPPYDSTQLG